MFALVTGVQPCALPIYHFGDPDSGLSLQPLRDLDTPADAEWAHGWLMTVLQLQGLRLDPHHQRELWGAVDALAAQPVHLRTITTLVRLVQDRAIKAIGRAHVCTPVTNAHLVCSPLLEK